MFSKNLKYYRLKARLTKRELASMVGVTPVAIGNYEKGTRKPSMEILKALAEKLQVGVADFLNSRNNKLTFSHGDFRKISTFSNADQEYVREYVEEYFSRFFTVVDILGDKVLPDIPLCKKLQVTNDFENDARVLRKHLGLAEDGPIDDLVNILENKGILVFEFYMEGQGFSGISGFVNNRPYITYNSNMTAERKRSTIAHELVHLMFVFPDSLDKKDEEKLATAIGGAFLLPRSDLERELGLHRSGITKDMLLVCVEYGVSLLLLAFRANDIGIVNTASYKEFMVRASKAGWRKNEPSRIDAETPFLFKQLVYRAINENEISINKGAELLQLSYDEVMDSCCFNGVE